MQSIITIICLWRHVLRYYLGKHSDEHALHVRIGDVGIDNIAILVLARLFAVDSLKIAIASALTVELEI